jgi:hypothetical protein
LSRRFGRTFFGEVTSAARGAIESKRPSALENAIGDGGGEVIVIQDLGPQWSGSVLVVKIVASFRMCHPLTT